MKYILFFIVLLVMGGFAFIIDYHGHERHQGQLRLLTEIDSLYWSDQFGANHALRSKDTVRLKIEISRLNEILENTRRK